MKQITITNAEAALLGLLAENKKHPYQIEKDVEFRSMRYWTDLSMSSIYKLLIKLEKKQLVQAETEVTQDNRARKVFSLTRKGKTVLMEKIAFLLSNPVETKYPFHVAIYNSGVLIKSTVIKSLKQYQEKLKKLILGYHDLESYLKQDNCPPEHLAVSIRPRYMLEGELRWIEEYIGLLDNTTK